MSKKYVIDLPDDAQYILINGASENHCYTRVEQVDDLEELNSDYINEHYGELQDTAYKKGLHDGESKCRYCNDYQRGFKDGKNSIDKGCEGCEHEGEPYDKSPCDQCCNAYINQYTPMPKQDDRIEVGDEVIYNGVTKCVVVTPETDVRYASLFDCNGIHYSADHRECKKTGKHYDIQSILEAMRTHD